MKNMKKFLSFILIIAVAVLANVGTANAQNSYVTINSADEIPTTFPNGQSYIPSSSANLQDYIGYFTGSNAGWEPRIKFMGTDASNIQNYLFCLSFHDLAPNSSITYTKDDYESVEKMNQVRYIIENGFGESFATYEDLKWHYYVTQLAIWQLQGMNGFDISNFDTADTVAKNAILGLVEGARNAEIDTTKYVGKYVASQSGYQMLVPAIIYNINQPVQNTPIRYYSSTPQTNNNTATNVITITYKDCNNNYIVGHQLRLVDSNRVEVKSWTSSNSKYTINDLESGSYTIEDITNGTVEQIVIENTTVVQSFIMNPDDIVCSLSNEENIEEQEEVEETTTETIITEISNIVNPSTGIASTVGVGSLLGGAIGLYRHSKKKLKMLRK